MTVFDPILTLLLFVSLIYRGFAAAFTDDDIKEIKHICWATLFAVTLFADLASRV